MMEWRKSNHSSDAGCVEVGWHTPESSVNGANCVEVGWHKSSISSTGNCVEAGLGDCGHVHVRDTKDRSGPVLTFTRREWADFLTCLGETS